MQCKCNKLEQQNYIMLNSINLIMWKCIARFIYLFILHIIIFYSFIHPNKKNSNINWWYDQIQLKQKKNVTFQMMMFDLLLHGGSAKPQISNVFCFYSSLEPVSLSLAVASFQNLIRRHDAIGGDSDTALCL